MKKDHADEINALSTSELHGFIAVTSIALKHAKESANERLAGIAQRDIDTATRELNNRA
jgi:hypothetical protein